MWEQDDGVLGEERTGRSRWPPPARRRQQAAFAPELEHDAGTAPGTLGGNHAVAAPPGARPMPGIPTATPLGEPYATMTERKIVKRAQGVKRRPGGSGAIVGRAGPLPARRTATSTRRSSDGTGHISASPPASHDLPPARAPCSGATTGQDAGTSLPGVPAAPLSTILPARRAGGPTARGEQALANFLELRDTGRATRVDSRVAQAQGTIRPSFR